MNRGLGLIAMLGLSGSGCLVVSDPQFEILGKLVHGSMMCSVCWDRPFCLNPDTGEAIAPGDEEEVCPDGWIAAAQATRVTSSMMNDNNFYCIVPDGKTVAAPPISPFDETQLHCGTAPDPSVHQHVDVCQDVPKPCRRPPTIPSEDLSACAPEDLPDSSEPLCPESNYGSYRAACGAYVDSAVAAEILAVDKLIQNVSVFGIDVPNSDDGPERYCFLSCFDTTDQTDCDPDLVDSPEIRPTSFTSPIEADVSSALVTIVLAGLSDTSTVPISGKLAFDIPAACRGPLPVGTLATCLGSLSFISLESEGVLSLAGQAITGIHLHNPEPIPTSISTRGATTTIILPERAVVFADGTIGSLGATGRPYLLPGGVTISIDWLSGLLTTSTTLIAEDDSSELILNLEGPLGNQPPTASTGPDQVVECNASGATVSLSASESVDPDGASDISTFIWSSTLNGSDGPTMAWTGAMSQSRS